MTVGKNWLRSSTVHSWLKPSILLSYCRREMLRSLSLSLSSLRPQYSFIICRCFGETSPLAIRAGLLSDCAFELWSDTSDSMALLCTLDSDYPAGPSSLVNTHFLLRWSGFFFWSLHSLFLYSLFTEAGFQSVLVTPFPLPTSFGCIRTCTILWLLQEYSICFCDCSVSCLSLHTAYFLILVLHSLAECPASFSASFLPSPP